MYDSATRELFDYALRLAGFAVVAARDGLAGLRAIEQQVPDAVALDLDLPDVSGMDVHQEIVSHGGDSRHSDHYRDRHRVAGARRRLSDVAEANHVGRVGYNRSAGAHGAQCPGREPHAPARTRDD